MASNMMDFYETLYLSLLSSNEHIKNVIKDPSPGQEPPRPTKLQQSVIVLQKFLMASNMMDFYETWNLSFLSSNEQIKDVIKVPSPSQEPPCPPELQQSDIILQEGSWWLQTWRIFMKLET